MTTSPTPQQPDGTRDGHTTPPAKTTRTGLLMLEREHDHAAAIALAATDLGLDLRVVTDPAVFRAEATSGRFGVVVIDADAFAEAALGLAADVSDADDTLQVIITTANPNLRTSIDSIRAGAADLIVKPFDPDELRTRLTTALQTAERMREALRRVDRLRRMCRRLTEERDSLEHAPAQPAQKPAIRAQAKSLAPNAHADAHLTIASEYTALIRRELDVERVLRVTLEYLLKRTGPTNAAIFLPTGDGDFSLGAYVNYDLPRDSADTLLDHLADSAPQRLASVEEILVMPDAAAIHKRLGDDAHWIENASGLAFASNHEGDCLAVVVLFRDSRSPFPQTLHSLLRIIRDLFAEQLARVVRIHNRMADHAEWRGFEVGDDNNGSNDTLGDIWPEAA